MDGITNSLAGKADMLLSRMQSDAAIRKASEKPEDVQSGQPGNVLGDFGSMLKHEMNNINNLQGQADAAVETYATGGDIELHNVILAVEKADMSLQLAMQIRNKMIGAYQEISRMQV